MAVGVLGAGLPLSARLAFARGRANPVQWALAGRPYRVDANVHFPSQAGVVDGATGCSFYFHAHRKSEYGHFHTFAKDEYGLSVHLLMISMDAEGRATALSTVNQWVTGDRHVKADSLVTLLDNFSIAPASFAPSALIDFVAGLLKSRRALAMELFEERDKWVAEYQRQTGGLPYADAAHHVISSREI